MKRRALKLLVAGCLLAAAGCRSRTTTEADCAAIFDRLFTLEWQESGFHDPVLEQQKHREVSARLAPLVQACRGSRLRADALACVAQARNAEELSHRCLH